MVGVISIGSQASTRSQSLHVSPLLKHVPPCLQRPPFDNFDLNGRPATCIRELARDRGDCDTVSRMTTGLDRFTVKGRETSVRVRQERAGQRAAALAPIIEEIRSGGATTLQATADALNARGIRTSRGGSWSAVQVSRVLARVLEQNAR